MASQVGTGAVSIALPTAAGAGLARPHFSFLMPGATGRLSHVRILAGYRSPDEAALFHNLVRESAG